MRDQGSDDARDALRARREHSKGDGNFPDARPHGGLGGETPRDRTPEDLPKERDPRNAPKGGPFVPPGPPSGPLAGRRSVLAARHHHR